MASWKGSISSFGKLRILVVGDAMLDSYIRGSINRISPEAPVPILSKTDEEKKLGGAANVAYNIKSLGATPLLHSVIGEDPPGDELVESLRYSNIQDSGILRFPNRETTVKTRILAGNHHLLRVDQESDEPISSAQTDQLIDSVSARIPECHGLIFQDYDKGCITPPLIEALTRRARACRIPVISDPKFRNFHHYRGVDLFKPNRHELETGTNQKLDPKNRRSLEKAASLLAKDMQLKRIMVTLSNHGIFYFSESEKGMIPGLSRRFSDPSGAGDTVASIASLCLCLGLPLQSIAQLSNLGGAIVCEQPGVVAVAGDHLIREANSLIPL